MAKPVDECWVVLSIYAVGLGGILWKNRSWVCGLHTCMYILELFLRSPQC